MSDILRIITRAKHEEIKAGRAKTPLSEMTARARAEPPPRSFAQALRAGSAPRIIAEFKRASPSKGLIRADADPAASAKAYAENGAACLSVLTDAEFFKGSGADLHAARQACSLPVLRKDFMYDIWQVMEARAMGADCILVIMAVVSQAQAQDLAGAARELHMDVLAESHNEDELAQALDLPDALIGVNSRDLKTFTTDLAIAEKLMQEIPPDRTAIAESGISSAADIARLMRSGFSAFLAGEVLMKAENPGAALAALIKA